MLNRREFLQAAALGGTAIGLVGCGSAAGNDAATPVRDTDAAATTEPVAVRTAALEPLATAIRTALPSSLAAGRKSADLSAATNYHAYARKYYYRPHYYDAAEALTALLPDEALRTPVLAALSQAVVRKAATTRYWIGPSDTTYQTVDLTTYSGVSLFVPQYIYTRNAKFTPYGDLNTLFQKTEWYSAAGWAQTGW